MTHFIRLVEERPHKRQRHDWRYIVIGCGIWFGLVLSMPAARAWASWGWGS